MGSSPLTRGKPFTTWVSGTASGLIPAHAGKTAPNGIKNFADGAHPRSRGENRLIHWPPRTLVGSSPLTRGKHHRRDHAGRGPGLIPAHAGKTPPPSAGSTGAWAHPRSRGENVVGTLVPGVQSGSSPLTRGKRKEGQNERRNPGLIPAHAGKTSDASLISRPAGAHPRSRGENLFTASARLEPWGSSPLTRGKLGLGMSDSVDKGLIPAHAGKTP